MVGSANMVLERLPPQNVEAEQALLGSLLLDRDAIIKLPPPIRPPNSYNNRHVLIYAATPNP